jgi:pimeloyl-ACP methyl ester carboxylesterase
MADVVLIPGSYHGGWYFEPLVAPLQARGHRVLTLTLPGLEPGGPGAPGDARAINLDTHIDAVIDLVRAEDAREVVLVGHSYGGMVLTGVLARGGVDVAGAVFLDAMLPQSGERLWDLIAEPLRAAFLSASVDGIWTAPPQDLAAIDPRVRPHPLATFLQPVVYDESAFAIPFKTYVWAVGYPGSPFAGCYARAASREGWRALTVPHGHDLMREAPDAVVELLVAQLEGARV